MRRLLLRTPAEGARLDVLRVLQRDPETIGIVLDALGQQAKGHAALEAQAARIQGMLEEPRLLDRRGRDLCEALAVLAAGTILRAHAPAAVSDAYLATRLGSVPRQTYGQGLDRADVRAIVDRALPADLPLA